jgi:hypothetical protein
MSIAVLLMLLGTPIETAVAFTLVNRLLYTVTDVIGLPSLLKAGTRIQNIRDGNVGGIQTK